MSSSAASETRCAEPAAYAASVAFEPATSLRPKRRAVTNPPPAASAPNAPSPSAHCVELSLRCAGSAGAATVAGSVSPVIVPPMVTY